MAKLFALPAESYSLRLSLEVRLCGRFHPPSYRKQLMTGVEGRLLVLT
jgi:hypothetical protein